MKIQEKTQDMQEPQEKNQDKFKKNFFKEKIEQHKIVQENFSRNIFYQSFYSLVIDYQKPKIFLNVTRQW